MKQSFDDLWAMGFVFWGHACVHERGHVRVFVCVCARVCACVSIPLALATQPDDDSLPT